MLQRDALVALVAEDDADSPALDLWLPAPSDLIRIAEHEA